MLLQTPSVLCDTTLQGLEDDLYDGLPVDRLLIDAVDVPEPMRLRRSDRYRGAVDIEPEHPIEAVFDPRRLVARIPSRAPVRRSGWSVIRRGWVGCWPWCWCPMVIPPGGLWHVATAWPAKSRLRHLYDGKESEDG